MNSILLIDIGNSLVKWAMSAQNQKVNPPFLHDGALAHADLAQLEATWAALPAPHAICLCSVAQEHLRVAIEKIARRVWSSAIPLQHFIAHAECLGVRNGYEQPHTLGADRFAALIGARALFRHEALLVCSFGTATTLDALTAQGEFVGGVILPGLGTMLNSLANNTAQLPRVVTQMVPSDVHFQARNTQAAILQGCLAAQSGAVLRAWADYAARFTIAPRLLLTGGYAQQVQAVLPSIGEGVAQKISSQVQDNLVLLGLAAFMKNDEK